jgi:DNA-binding transcriptional LysR family regulator
MLKKLQFRNIANMYCYFGNKWRFPCLVMVFRFWYRHGFAKAFLGGATMDLRGLRYFLKTATTGSFLATARHFQVPASSVSRFIAALEKELGRQLLYRSTRAVRLTEDGTRFLLQAREALGLLDDAVEELVQGENDIGGSVNINAPEALGRLHIADIVNRLQEKHPDLKVELTLTDVFIDPVQEGADITVRVGPLMDSGLIGRVISPQRFLLAASPAYLELHGIPSVPADLPQHHCLLYKGRHGEQQWYFRHSTTASPEAVAVSGPLRSNNAEVLVAAARAGRGMVLFPTWLFDPQDFAGERLVSLMPEWCKSASQEEAYIQLLSPENRLRSRKVREVSAYFLEAIGTPPYWDRW